MWDVFPFLWEFVFWRGNPFGGGGIMFGNVGICGGLHISRMVVEMLEIRVSSEVRSF